jgi:predicted phosphodiesterase
MRLLLVSDTHGHLEVVNRLADETKADAVVHAGDLGFCEPQTIERLTLKEVALRILHSDLPREAVQEARKLEPEPLRALLMERVGLGDFPDYLTGHRRFTKPVYAVWGNHEDKEVIEALREGRTCVENLHLLDEPRSHRIGPVSLPPGYYWPRCHAIYSSAARRAAIRARSGRRARQLSCWRALSKWTPCGPYSRRPMARGRSSPEGSGS